MAIWVSALEDSNGKVRIERDLTGPITDEWIIVNNDKNRGEGTVGIVIDGTASAKVEFTAQKYETISTGTPIAAEWEQGTVSVSTFGTFPPSVTGIRFVVASGTVQGVLSI